MVKLKKFLPKSLLGRSLLIIVVPLVIVQLVSAYVFYETHWDKISVRLARGLSGDISTVISLMQRYPGPENRDWIFDLAASQMELSASFSEGEAISTSPAEINSHLGKTLASELSKLVNEPYRIDAEYLNKEVLIEIQMSDGALSFLTTRKRLFSSTTYVFVIWMVGTSLLLFGVATIFMRNQIRSVRRLAAAADAFGMGRDTPSFKPEGANEVRQAASAFIAMRDRISRHINQRTEMLAGVSHDLRTPLTRMKLQLALLDEVEGAAELHVDINEMERMLDEYLAFAGGSRGESPILTNLSELLEDIVSRARRKGGNIDLHTEGPISVLLKPDSFRRCVTNLIDNATRYGKIVSVVAGRRG
ncbi:MAG: HAMP domain-containing protein, partial [Rhodospirillales bacterium]|nr:HAMP domain-containing protein [Rhodospirillales bacterium]